MCGAIHANRFSITRDLFEIQKQREKPHVLGAVSVFNVRTEGGIIFNAQELLDSSYEPTSQREEKERERGGGAVPEFIYFFPAPSTTLSLSNQATSK
jgi:hypothetical protein